MKADKLFNRVKNQFLKPVEKIFVSDWSEQHLQLPQTSAEPGLWRRDRAPYQSGLMDAVCEPNVRKVTIMTSAQTGKSTVCNAIIARYIDIDPCPICLPIGHNKSLKSSCQEGLGTSQKKEVRGLAPSTCALRRRMGGALLKNAVTVVASITTNAFIHHRIYNIRHFVHHHCP